MQLRSWHTTEINTQSSRGERGERGRIPAVDVAKPPAPERAQGSVARRQGLTEFGPVWSRDGSPTRRPPHRHDRGVPIAQFWRCLMVCSGGLIALSHKGGRGRRSARGSPVSAAVRQAGSPTGTAVRRCAHSAQIGLPVPREFSPSRNQAEAEARRIPVQVLRPLAFAPYLKPPGSVGTSALNWSKTERLTHPVGGVAQNPVNEALGEELTGRRLGSGLPHHGGAHGRAVRYAPMESSHSGIQLRGADTVADTQLVATRTKELGMPLPLVPIAVIAALLGLGAGVVVLAKSLAGKHVAILGRQQVGKTTLLQYLRDGKVPSESKRTVDPIPGGDFDMEISGKTVHWKVKQDLPGNDSPAYKHWRDAFEKADYVWYLFRSDLIANGDPDEVQGVKDHLDMLRTWKNELGENPRRIMLIGTWADQDSMFNEKWEEFDQVVKQASPIKTGSLGLGADVVVGSLATTDGADRLAKRIGRYLN